MKKWLKHSLTYILCGCLLFSTVCFGGVVDVQSRATNKSESSPDGYSQEILIAYEELCEYIECYEIPANISLETFQLEFETGQYETLEDFLRILYAYMGTINPYGNTSSTAYTLSRNNWYYNTGTRLTAAPVYSRYNLLSTVKAGDIIYEAAGGSGLTGHTSIVEGIYYDAYYGRYYIRIIEAIGYSSGLGQGDGVCRGVLDDDRLDNREGTVLRVSSASSSAISSAISFCVGQIGKDYGLDLLKGTSASEPDWYCSELVWAAYKNQGIDLDANLDSVAVFPAEILNSSYTSTVSVASIGTPQNVRATLLDSTHIGITWNSVSGATKYEVYYSTSYNGPFYYLDETTSTSFTDTGIASGGTQYYRVLAKKNSVKGNMSDPKGVKNSFVAPTIINIYTPSSTSAYLAWNAVLNATSYKVYRATSANGTYTLVATTTSTSYTNTGLTTGTQYYYKVVALNGSAATSYSSSRTITPTKVLSPQVYYGGIGASNTMILKWTYIPGATSYAVYIADNIQNPVYELAGTFTKTSGAFVLDTYSTNYCVKVMAKGSSGNSVYSSVFYISR